MQVPIVCKTDGVEAHLCLSLLKHDKVDVGCYQMIDPNSYCGQALLNTGQTKHKGHTEMLASE